LSRRRILDGDDDLGGKRFEKRFKPTPNTLMAGARKLEAIAPFLASHSYEKECQLALLP
jgi:hypothetical protein